jgi:gliding motility-associated-like protein
VLTLITPQGDGFNEFFEIACLSRFSDNTLEIYNRWGQLVREYENYNEGDLWNGTDNRGNMVDDGVYFYVFDYLDPVANQRITKKGSVTVLRK